MGKSSTESRPAALTSKFVPGMLTGGKAVGVFLHALRLDDGSGYKVILEAAPPERCRPLSLSPSP